MSSKFLSFEGLKEAIDSQNPVKAKEIVDNICKFFDQDLSTAELAHAVEVIYSDQTGTLAFLNKSLKDCKRFSDSNVRIFDLWIKIFQNYGKQISFDAYVENIIAVCLQFAVHSNVSAKEKENATIVLQELLKNDLVLNVNISPIVGKLLNILHQKGKQGTFRQELYKLLGVISWKIPGSLASIAETTNIMDVFLKPLEAVVVNEESIQFNTLTGALQGLNLYLINFASSSADESETRKRIYIAVKRLSDPMDSNKKATFRAAIDLFTDHAPLLSPFIFKDAEYWHKCLLKWVSSVYDDRRKGIYALYAFHQVMANEIAERNNDNDRDTLRFFINYFREILESRSSPSYLSRIAIRGFGVMSRPCKCLLPEMLDKLTLLVMQRTELVTIAEDNELRDGLEHFPDYVEALSQIIMITPDRQIVEMLTRNVEIIAIRLIKDFHYLSRAHTQLVVSSLLKAFYNLHRVGGALLDSVLEKVIFAGVIWTCSHKLVYDANLDWYTDIDWKENITYKSYFPLWEGLIIVTERINYDRPLISEKIFNNLMKSLFAILNKLDFRTKRRIYTDEDGTDKEFYFCDPNIDLCPIKPEDFHIFFNVVDLYKDLFWVNYRSELFTAWIQEYCSNMLRLAMQNPLVSGFLKLLEVGLAKADFLHYFDDTIQLDVDTLRSHLTHFLKYLITKSQKISGELQIACLELILKYPCQFYEKYIVEVTPIFVIALEIGKSLVWMANLAIKAMEKMVDVYPENSPEMQIFFKRVLPCFDSFLQSRSFEVNANSEIHKVRNMRRVKKPTIIKFTESELTSLQRRIIAFLGRLSPQSATMMIVDGTNLGNLGKWETDQSLRVILNFPTMRPSIYLDTMMPRICELALHSSDRKTKISACELVHGIVLYLMGIRKYKGQIWKEVCRNMLVLGSDGDTTVQQMFEPLLKQVMHYMAKPDNADGVEPLMDALMCGISNNGNSSVRDLSAVCLREFVEWSIKHSAVDRRQSSPGCIAEILENLHMYSFDSDGAKRNGAALAFNNLYRILRSQESICDIYFIDLLHTFCVNFKLSEELSSAPLVENLNSDLEQVSMSLDHIVRVLKERNDIFNKPQQDRIVPSTFDAKILKDVVTLLLTDCGSKLMNYRRKCMAIVNILATKITNIVSIGAFLKKYFSTGDVRAICEGFENGTGIKARPNLDFIKNEQTSAYSLLYSWLQQFLASLDCYCWLMDICALEGLDELFEGANIFDVVSYYLKNICWQSPQDIFNKIGASQSTGSYDSGTHVHWENLYKIESIKSLITVRIIDFLSITHLAGCAKSFPVSYWSENNDIFKKFLNQITLEAHKLNFDFRAQNILKKLPAQIEKCLTAMGDKCIDKEFIAELQRDVLENMKEKLKHIYRSIEEILYLESVSDELQNSVKGIRFICKHLSVFRADTSVRSFLKSTSVELFSDLFLKIKKVVRQKELTFDPSPSIKRLVNELMSICFMVNHMAANVVHCLLDTTVLHTMSATTTTTHGEHFLAVYKSTVFEYCDEGFIENVISKLLHNITSNNFHQILNFLIELVDHLFHIKTFNALGIRVATDCILTNLKNIMQLVVQKNEQITFNKLMVHLVNAAPYELFTFREKSPGLEEWILDQLQSETLSLKSKSNIIHLLPAIVGPGDKKHAELSNALENVQRQYFPLRSSEFVKNSLEETALKYVFKYLLSSLVISKSYVILDFLIKCTATDGKHVIEWMIRDSLRNYTASLAADEQMLQLDLVLQTVSNQSIEPKFRLTILDRFLLTMIQNCRAEGLEKFYVNNIKKLVEMIDKNYGSGNSGWIVEHALVDRIIGFSLIEVMFACLPKESLSSRESSIGRQLLGDLKVGTELVGTLTKKSFYSRTEVFVTDDPVTRELFRQYQCAAYRSVCSLVSNTQTGLQFYSKFIFEENLTKNELVWYKLVDCTNDSLYQYDGQETEDYLKVKERFVSIRKLNPRPAVRSVLPTYSSKQLQTQSVFQSSLSQDVSKLDLNYTTVRTDAEAYAQKERLAGVVSVHLERTALNKHEVMPILCGVIEHMVENGIAPKPSPGTDSQPVYKWITSIASAMENNENHRNVRLFLAQVVHNCREIFQYYAYALFSPVLRVLVDECAGTKLNFYITDLVAMLLSWTSKKFYTPSNPEEKHLISQLLKFLMKNAYHAKREIFKFNLELIQSVIHLWKNCISVPCQLLLDLANKSNSVESQDNRCGVTLLGLVLNAGLDVWTQNTKTSFFSCVMRNLENTLTAIYQAASSVLGMMLKKLQAEEDNEFLEKFMPDLINNVKNVKKKNKKKMIDIVYGIHKSYPDIIDAFRETITFDIPLVLGSIKCIYLEMLLARIETYGSEDLYKILVSIGINDILKNLDYQHFGLHLINKSIRKMVLEDIVKIFPSLEACTNSKKSECRDVAYEILIYLALNYAHELNHQAHLALLKGLVDCDTKIQDRIFHFWSNETSLSSNVEERILNLVSDFSVTCEKQFLGFCSQLILQLPIENAESKRQVFEFQRDDDSKLMEYQISTQIRVNRTNTLPPLFAESHNTRRSLLLGSQSYNYVQTNANNEYFFEPTLDPTKTRTVSQFFSLPSQSGLPFVQAPQTLGRNSQVMRSAESAETMSLDKVGDKLRKRFITDKEKATRHRALQVIDRRAKQMDRFESDMRRKETEVILYRRYRNGDYPDLLINHLALLMPLQGLVKRDTVIARKVFVSIFSAVLGELGPEYNMYIVSISSKIQAILDNAKSCDPMIFATFLEIALLDPAKFDFAPELVAMLAKATNMLAIGAIYLETRINVDWDTDAFSAKSSSTVPIDEQHWLHLSDIYNSLAEYDVVSSIFADNMRTDPRLAEATDLKANGKYTEAQELLLEVIQRRVQVEHYYAYICYYECFVEMGMWSELSRNIQNQVDDYDELWTDDYNMAFLLPNLMQSELQLILQGQSQNNDFLRILETWTADPQKSDYIKRTFCEELMMLHVADREFRQARVFGESYMKAFLMDWSVISSMNIKLRLKYLLNVQKVAEIDQYALLLAENFNERSVAAMNNRWDRCTIGEWESLRFWNSVITYRTYIGHLIKDLMGNVNSEGLFSNQLENVMFRMRSELFNAALLQKNHILSGKLLNQLKSSCAGNRNTFNLYCEIATIKQDLLENQSNTTNKLSDLDRIWNLSDNIIQNNEKLKDDLALNLDMLKLHADIGKQILNALATEDVPADRADRLEIKQRVFQQSLLSLKQAVELSESATQTDDVKAAAASSFCKLAQFCYDHRDTETDRNSHEIDKLIVKYVLLAMKYGSKQACQLFPSILQLPSIEDGSLHAYFNVYSSDVPEWMFFSWIPQIISRLDFHSSCYLDDLVRRISLAYPHALIYPFNEWCERYLSDVQSGGLLRSEIQEIFNNLRNPVTDMFIKNFGILCIPEALLITHLDELTSSICHKGLMTQSEFKQHIDRVLDAVFIKNKDLQGRAFRSIQAYKSNIENLKTFNIQDGFAEFAEQLQQIKGRVRAAMQSLGTQVDMEAICPWLAKFQWCGEEMHLELPGQYEDDVLPKVDDHVKIVKFGKCVDVFKSLRRPFRIKIYGSNAKSFDFLVKYGEDLKQDQRIQQLLRLMSLKLAEDQNCRNHNLFIRTFKVVPIDSKSGMMSWVADSTSLQDFIREALSRNGRNGDVLLEEASRKYTRFIKAPSSDEPRVTKPIDVFGKAAQHYSRNQLIANQRNLENIISSEILRSALLDMAVSPDSFYVLRNNFATSLAAMNIGNWILGIGDRHLLNILINTKDATLTGVDFGCTFGSGVRNLPVPELFPFRLTSHIVGAMTPMGTSGLISKCMSHTLRVLRNSKTVLMACMEVFVQEPMINWTVSKRIGAASSDESDSYEEWEPRDRIEIAKQKLLGYNPMHLLVKELQAGIFARYPEYLEAYINILRGDHQFNIRARLPEKNLTVEQQVKCLIDLACDPATLGIAYEGFLPWL